MDDPTKNLIPRSSIEYYLRKETVSTNPYTYEAHEKFSAYMDDPEISQFGRWMCSNGINAALVAIEVDLDKIPSAKPEIVRCKDCKHRPFDGEDTRGFGVEFPDEKCPCQCDDGWYNWRPNDEWFCADAERKEVTE